MLELEVKVININPASGLIVGYAMYKKQSEKAVETGLYDVAGEILDKVKSAGQLKESR